MAKDGPNFVFLGGGDEQEELAKLLAKSGFSSSIIGFQEGIGQTAKHIEPTIPSLQNMPLEILSGLLEELREGTDPVEYEKVFVEALSDPESAPADLWQTRSGRSQMEQLSLYRDFKAALLNKYYQSDENSKRFYRCFNTDDMNMKRMEAEQGLPANAKDEASTFYQCLMAEVLFGNKDRELSDAENLDDQGDSLNHMGRYEEALPYFEQSLARSPKFCLTWVNKGIALKNLGRLDEATACYDHVINEIDPDYKKAWYNKAVAQMLAGNLKEAKRCNDRALAISPEYEYPQRLKVQLQALER